MNSIERRVRNMVPFQCRISIRSLILASAPLTSVLIAAPELNKQGTRLQPGPAVRHLGSCRPGLGLRGPERAKSPAGRSLRGHALVQEGGAVPRTGSPAVPAALRSPPSQRSRARPPHQATRRPHRVLAASPANTAIAR